MNPAMKEKLAELKLELAADKKKTGVLAALTIVVLVLGVRWLAGNLGGPSAASAGETKGVAAGHPTALGKPLRAPTLREPADYWASDETPQRDPFLLNASVFGLETEITPAGGEGPKSGQDGDEISDASGDSEDAERARVRELAAELRLRSTMVGSTPLAVFEHGGQRSVVRAGEEVAGFTLVEVTAGRAVLEMNGVRIAYEQ